MAASARRAAIARLNDEFRRTGARGRIFVTAGVSALSVTEQGLILAAVRGFVDFNQNNDPHGEHDCAALSVGRHRIIWKIDYLPVDGAVEPDPTRPATVLRVLTVMLAEEY